MDRKSVLLLLGLWKSIFCQECEFSSDPTLQELNSNSDYGDYDTTYNTKPCEITYNCKEISDITNFDEGNQYSQYCSDWKIRVIFESICQFNEYDTYFSNNINQRIFEFEISDSACSRLPSFEKLTNIEVIHMHNTNLKDMSISSQLKKLSLLDLSQNKISIINKLELYSSSNLQVLNVSNNMIYNITDQVFQHVSSLKKLDLASNKIDNINSLTFYGLVNLNTLYLSHNRISDINSAFQSLTELEELYLDDNNLHEIKENCFQGLEKLTILKLNYNFIIKFDWKTMKDIPMLKIFDASYNRIENVKKTAFAKNNDLSYVDLSSNNITKLFPNTFLEKKISYFAIQNNNLEGDLEFGMFEGIITMTELDLSHQHIGAVRDNAFYGLTSLSTLLLNDNRIQNITNNSFNTLVDLKHLDLSNNMLHFIDLGDNELNNLKSLQFRNNFIADIGRNSFMKMQSLEFLDLSQNNLTTFNSDTYGAILPHLERLNISNNSLQIIQEDIFDKFVNILSIDLSYNSNLTIVYNSTKLTLAQASSDLRTLRITNCNIDKTFFLKMTFFITILHLDFTHNEILNIEYGMFSSNKKLENLDLSFNKISYIQPGSFKDNNELDELNLAHNELLKIEHGCFLGLNKLNILDISFNKIKTLKHGKFYETSSLKTLRADNNKIESVEYRDFVGANLSTLSIGENPIPCVLLVNLKTETHSLKVIALNEEHHLPNFNGVSCYSDSDKNNSNNTADNNSYSERREVLLEDIRNILLEIKKANYSEGSDSGKKISLLLQIFNVTQSIKGAFYKIDEATDRLIDNMANLNKNSKLAQVYANMSALAQNIIETVNKSDETNSKIIQLITKINVNSEMHSNNLQLVCLISQLVCLILIAILMLCLMGYKAYQLNLFSLSRRRRAKNLQHSIESTVTDTRL